MKNKILYFFIGLFFSITILLTAIEVMVFNNSHYDRMFSKYEITEVTGLEAGELSLVIQDVLEYLKDDREVLDTGITNEEGLIRSAFGERAILHMVDVKRLFVRGRLIRTSSLVLFISLVAYIMIQDKGWQKKLSRALLRTSGTSLLLIFLLYILMQLDFYQYFTYFHLIFFNNDLWILDPNSELLIQMLPEGLFFDTAVRIALTYIAANLLTGIFTIVFINKIMTKKAFVGR